MVTNRSDIAEKARIIANHGQPQKHTHVLEGRNSRMDGMHAAVLSVKLKHLDTWTDERIAAAARYNESAEQTIPPSWRCLEYAGKQQARLPPVRHVQSRGAACTSKDISRGKEWGMPFTTPPPACNGLLPALEHSCLRLSRRR